MMAIVPFVAVLPTVTNYLASTLEHDLFYAFTASPANRIIFSFKDVAILREARLV